MTEPVKKSPSTMKGSSNAPTIVLDVGKQKKKRVKELRRGTGPLMVDVAVSLDELRRDGKLSDDAQTVIVVVRQKPGRPKGLSPWL
jgi:hypothetical protein